MSSPLEVEVAIVGAGASGTVVCAQLLLNRPSTRIALVDPVGFGRGLAYSTRDPAHLLNVPAAKMSALEQDPEHFLRWVRAQGLPADEGTFVPRNIYGRYLEQLLEEAKFRAADGGGLLSLVSDEVTSVIREGAGWRLSGRSGQDVRATAVVLAVGNAAPEPLPLRAGAEHLAKSPLAFASPWAPGALEPTPGTVLLVGSGLTAVDAALALDERGHPGPIVALSRHGLLPQVHEAAQAHPLELDDRTLRGVLRTVRRAIAEPHGSGWRAVVDALRPHTQQLWRGFTHAERRRFLRHLRHLWDTHRHRMAPEVGAKISALIASGRLTLERGRLQAFEPATDGATVRVTFSPPDHGPLRTVIASRVINCTGPARLTRIRSPLLEGLLAAGWVRPDPLGFGLDAQPSGQLLDREGRPAPGLYTLGPPQRGEGWETTAMPEIRAQAHGLAAAVLSAAV